MMLWMSVYDDVQYSDVIHVSVVIYGWPSHVDTCVLVSRFLGFAFFLFYS